MNKKTIVTLSALACMAFASTCSAQIVKDSAGQPHYIPAKETRTVMQAADFDARGNWIVPANVLAMKGEARPVHEILQLTEEEFAVYCQGEGGQMPNRFIKADSPVVPVQKIFASTNPEVENMDGVEFTKWLNSFYGNN